jgi:hypothetical protein
MRQFVAATAAGAACAVLSAAPAEATQERRAHCVVQASGQTYDGHCMLLPEDDRGSFSIAPDERPYFSGTVRAITVTVSRIGVAEVTAFDAGPARDWGTAIRSPENRQCWIGRGFLVCVD